MQVPVLAELKRRRAFRALVGYGIATFAVLQIIEPVMHGLHWPDAVLSYVVVGLAVGFPVVVTLAWIFDVKAGRIERTPPPAQMKPATVALLLAGIGALAAAPGLAWYFLIHPRVTAGAARSDHSIAVLPFASLSAGEENKNFADAIHIELLSQLAKIGDLKVISRTSVLQYREGPKNVREIAEALGVSSVLEGSVQREGNRVRVQAQLIDAVGDREIWAERYDRELIDLFLIQTSIAEEISKALHARLLPEERSRIARRPTGNPDAYDAYLSAWELANRAHLQGLPAAELLYRRALGLDPDFALAWARLSFLHSTMYWFNFDHSKARLAQAREAADRALALQPDLPEAHAALGIFHYWSGRDYQRALDEFRTALRSDPYVREYIAWVQRRQGRFDEALARQRREGRWRRGDATRGSAARQAR
jgi:TolB-like protein